MLVLLSRSYGRYLTLQTIVAALKADKKDVKEVYVRFEVTSGGMDKKSIIPYFV